MRKPLFLSSTIRSLISRVATSTRRKTHRKTESTTTRGRYECLEDRRMLADITVAWHETDPLIRGQYLRDAIAEANMDADEDTIVFASEYGINNGAPHEILLVQPEVGSGDIEIKQPLKIVGPGSDKVVISGNRDGVEDDFEATGQFPDLKLPPRSQI